MPQEEDVEVCWEDQKSINSFGRLNTRMHELEEELKEKAAQHELLDDAANEIILADDDEPIRRAARGSSARVWSVDTAPPAGTASASATSR